MQATAVERSSAICAHAVWQDGADVDVVDVPDGRAEAGDEHAFNLLVAADDAGRKSRRLGALGDPDQAAQDRGRTLEALLRLLPIVEQHDLHVRPHARSGPLLANEGDQALGIGECIVAERDHRALGPGFDLLDIGAPAQRLDGDDLQQMLDLDRQRAEAVGKLGAECLDLALVLDLGEPR